MTKIVRLWWRCSLCRRRFDLFGVAHSEHDDRRSAGFELLGHLHDRHDLDPATSEEAAGYAVPDGKTTRVVVRNRTLVTL